MAVASQTLASIHIAPAPVPVVVQTVRPAAMPAVTVTAFDGVYKGTLTMTLRTVSSTNGKVTLDTTASSTNPITIKVAKGSVTIPEIIGAQQSGSVTSEGQLTLKISFTQASTSLSETISGAFTTVDGKVNFSGKATFSSTTSQSASGVSVVSKGTGTGTVTASGKQLAFGNKVSEAFRNKVLAMAERLGVDPNWLMAVMAFESNFNPAAKNPNSSASGLIQLTEENAKALGTSTAQLRGMSAEQQLDYVEKYLVMIKQQRKTNFSSLEDLYMAVLRPSAVGKPNNTVLFSRGSKEYDQNPLDTNRDGNVTKDEAAAKVRDKLREGLQPGNASITPPK